MLDDLMNSNIPVTSLSMDGIGTLDMLRLDLVHPVISGNKWFKLKHNLLFAKENSYKTVLTFGGAYSNHLVATAAAASLSGLKSIGVVRGLHAQERRTSTLEACEEWGMQLEFISREEYNKKDDDGWLDELRSIYPGVYIIPEGGNNTLGIKGVEEIVGYIPKGYTHIAVSVGSGTTFTGLRNALHDSINIIGFVPMKNGRYLVDEIQPGKGNWTLKDDYHFGGFGKWNTELIDFINTFYNTNSIPLDIVYTAKMLYGLQQMIQDHYFEKDARVLCIHTGGLQGNLGIQDKLVFKIPLS